MNSKDVWMELFLENIEFKVIGDKVTYYWTRVKMEDECENNGNNDLMS